MSAPSFPVQLRLDGRRCLVVGGGTVAARKIDALLGAGAAVTVVAPRAVAAVARSDDIAWHQRRYVRGEVASYRLAVAATDDPDTNAQVFRDGEAAGVFVNAADDPDHCSFTLPAVVSRGPIQVAVATDGASPAVAGWLRRRIEADLGPEYETLLELAVEVRHELLAGEGTSENPGWPQALDAAFAQLVRGRPDQALHALRVGVGLAVVTEVAS